MALYRERWPPDAWRDDIFVYAITFVHVSLAIASGLFYYFALDSL